MSQTITTAVFPVAGFGTRMLPATKSVPKEMLTVVDRPLVHYVVQEALNAGIKRFVFVTGRNKQCIEDYFDHIPELEDSLEAKQKLDLLEAVRSFPDAGEAIFLRQQKPLGLGHAVWCARHVIDAPFAVLLPDVILKDDGFLARMVQLHEKTKKNVVALQRVDPEHVFKYGIVGHKPTDNDEYEITSMVEKPSVGYAPSDMSLLGRYIFTPEIIDLLEHTQAGKGGEIQLTDAMQSLLLHQGFSGLDYRGKLFDCGSREGFIEANLDLAYDDPSLRTIIEQWVKDNMDIGSLFSQAKVA
ncbi:MAG: UTP--glucose-1-phosphate uridylyltransferase [Alphaproteobacteria bacterium]|nr:MAG: UTP--glucose-1-phosphate uridylyltransferase [Alphaproteobacteria bacterium]